MRPSREEVLVETAFVWAKRSTCSRLAVGAVIHREGRILVQGYNGAPAGLPHCNHECNCTPIPALDGVQHMDNCNTRPQACRAVHAEQNAISWAARVGVALQNAEIVCTHQPCLSCARSIINAGIISVTYVHPYRLREGLLQLEEAGIRVEQYLDWEEPSLIGLTSD